MSEKLIKKPTSYLTLPASSTDDGDVVPHTLWVAGSPDQILTQIGRTVVGTFLEVWKVRYLRMDTLDGKMVRVHDPVGDQSYVQVTSILTIEAGPDVYVPKRVI